ncbi:MAG: anhydro-N-acetylmuramic acid kinase [Alphaproteobacteria bacterium]|nr:anhydro-N-acetylmuramic acid kinase [Alphaproteobacteria bacterium]
MKELKLQNHIALGLYSDPSALAIESVIFETDGLDIKKVWQTMIRPYPHDLREMLLQFATQKKVDTPLFNNLSHDVTQFFIQVAKEIMEDVRSENVVPDCIGLSGHSAIHNPEEKVHLNFGDAATIARALKVPVVHHFVKEDLNAGGVGSPLLTTFWEAICKKLGKPLAVIGLGGVSHIVYIGPMGELVGFDIGQGLSLLDRWVVRHTGQELDFNGILGAKGQTNERVLRALLQTPFLLKKPPKSVQKVDFIEALEQVEGLSPEDGAATLTDFVVHSIIEAQKFLPETPAQWICIGGGTYNPTLMLKLSQNLSNVTTAQGVLPYTDALNAMGFGFIAVRHIVGLPITFPSTTGVTEPLSGGETTYPD